MATILRLYGIILMDIILILLLITFSNFVFFENLSRANHFFQKKYLWILFLIHIILSFVYFVYAGLTISDSVAYYKTASNSTEWLIFFDTGSPFIRFLAWPFCNYLQLSYYATMLLFSYFGFIGILLFYVAAKENTEFYNGNRFTIVEWIFLLPNIHFWSSSIGKGSIITLGISLFFWGLSRFNYRIFYLIIGALIIYLVRPHILFTSIAGIGIALLFVKNGISKGVKYFLISVSLVMVYFLTNKVLEYAETDSLNILNSTTLSHRAQELSKSSSGVDISNYNPLFKLFTLWFRPLFIDATGFMGIVVSFENVLLLVMFIMLIKNFVFTKMKFNGWFLSCLVAFILGSFALAQVSGNLGIALRQKAQLMPLFFILYVKCIEWKNKRQATYE